tara:strand:+ start:187978 stop:189264 length:1287 start_codon:yes stop_codon:yes gene_type:complete
MPISVALINTYTAGGGAGIACARLYKALNDEGSIETLLINDGQIQSNPDKILPLKKWAKYSNLFRYFTERFLVKSALKKDEWGSLFSPAILSNPSSINTIKNNRSNILHLHWINHGFLGLDSLHKLRFLKRPIVWTLHDMWAFTGGCHHSMDCNGFQSECGSCLYLSKPSSKDLSHQIWKKKKAFFNSLDITVVCPSNWLANKARESSLFKHRRIEVIPNPLDCNTFKPTDKNLAKSELKLPADKKHICFVSANINSPFKGINKLIDALKTLETLYVDASEIEIIVLGKIDSEDLFADLTFKAHFGGYITSEAEMVSYYNAADVFVLPSLQDNLPNTVMEALACGTPVAAFDTGGVSDMVDENVGYLAKYNDSDDLAQGLFELLSNDNDRLRKGINAVEKVKTKFSYPVVAKKYSELYHQVVKQYQSA